MNLALMIPDMAAVDWIVLGAMVVFGFFGLFSGFLAQLFSITALAAAWFLSRPVGKVVAEFISARSKTPPAAAYVLGCFLAGMVIYTVARLIFRVINHFVGKTAAPIKATNRLLGGAFGGAKAFAIAWIVLCLVAAFPQYFQNKKPDLHAMLQGSQMDGIIEKWNPVKESRLVAGARSLNKIIKRDPKALERLKQDPQIAEFLSVVKEKLAAKAPDDEAAAKIRAGDLSALRNLPAMMDFLDDPEVKQAFQKVDLNASLMKVAREVE